MPASPEVRHHTSAPHSPTLAGAGIHKPKKQVACQKCHARKVKCSGGKPCVNCRQAGDAEHCIYPSRDRQVKISQSYLDQLLKENQSLRNSASESPNTIQPDEVQKEVAENDESHRNPLLAESPWFQPVETHEMPIHIGEAADAAFATRFRQALVGAPERHIPRTDYLGDKALASFIQTECPWPSPVRSRFLVKVALRTVCQCYHIVRKSRVLKGLETAIQNPLSCDSVFIGKLWALFAIGEIYSAKTAPSDGYYPGLAYYAQATRRLGELSERPKVGAIEMRLLMTVYSLCLNRRHGAYFMAGSAVRLGIVMGLHLNIPEFPSDSRDEREHRKRVFWTAFIFDRIWSSKMGQPTVVQDEDVEIDYPSNEGLSAEDLEDFGDPEYLNTHVRLAKLAGEVTKSIYSRRTQRSSFTQRVQHALKNLTGWVESLPPSLQIDTEQPGVVGANVKVALHLSFNQCLIVATRPILLHVLRLHRNATGNTPEDAKPPVPASAIALAEACVRCARHSYRLLSESWIDGTFSNYDYFYTQYLFSAATVLAISSLLKGKGWKNDADDFEASAQFLAELKQNGNFAAKEFCRHIDAIRLTMQAVAQASYDAMDQSQTNSTIPGTYSVGSDTSGTPYATGFMTTGMALAEPGLQDFLAQPDIDLQFFGLSSAYGDDLQGLFLPNLQSDGWAGT